MDKLHDSDGVKTINLNNCYDLESGGFCNYLQLSENTKTHMENFGVKYSILS